MGLYLDGVINALIDNNTISDCTSEAIYLSGCTDLVLHHNYMFDNNLTGGFSAYDDGTTNIWDDGSRGNYWSEYPVYYPTATSDGFIWSIPYDVRGGGVFQDRYPLSCFDGLDGRENHGDAVYVIKDVCLGTPAAFC